MLRDRGVQRVFLAGLAVDVCVPATARDAVGEGFATFIEDACRPSKPEANGETRARLAQAGVTLVREEDLS